MAGTDIDTSKAPTDEYETEQSRSRTNPEGRDACLVVIGGERIGTRVVPDGNPITIGRDPDCEFQIAKGNVSRRHCRLYVEDNEHWIEDLDSTNHTFVNDSRIERVALRDGDQIRICETTLKFIDEDNIESHYHSKLYEYTIRDPLTGMFNRRHAMRVLDTEVARAGRESGYVFSLALLDIDHFKIINDEFGHLAGDEVLEKINSIAERRIRASDTLARIGGEEFLLIIPGADREQAMTATGDLCGAIAEFGFQFDGESRHVTLSAGIASWREDLRVAGDLLREADDHLYIAKNEGRNQIR